MPENSKRHPYIKWYGRDWLGDTMLRTCTATERGIWIDMLCVMMAGQPYGYLSINNVKLTDEDMSKIIGCPIEEYRAALKSLESKGITSRDNKGMLYSRRLVREYNKMMLSSEYGKRGGGNPNLSKELFIPESLSNIEGFEIEWRQFLENRKLKGSPATRHAQELLLKKLSERPADSVSALQTAITRNWTGFEWEWIRSIGASSSFERKESPRDIQARIDAAKGERDRLPERGTTEQIARRLELTTRIIELRKQLVG